MYLPVPAWLALIVRKAAVTEHALPSDAITLAMKGCEPAFEDSDLIVYGPLFGQEAQKTYSDALQAAGLTYVDDFYELSIDLPAWLQLGARLSEAASVPRLRPAQKHSAGDSST